MKKQNLLALAIISLSSILLLLACNTPDPAPLPEKIQKLIQTNWKINEITVPKKTGSGDSSILLSCMNDDLTLFGSNGVFELQDGTLKCDSTNFYYSKGYWGYDLNNDSVQLAVITPASKYISWKVLTLNDSVLKVTYIDSLVPANKITKTISFKK
ncbi:hypothetical protein FRZ67_01360 [Panacibacter ginsenosidivorans]|uniref:Lipocalin-like domain-containing protein n=1 Tax=Panacibacter ginsenosidivorans TaxID=1813871 RepID=A0A5B8V5W7_9BACT|nr:hypothetical protein [Panacibacter ginsenosidivorans]QEC66016.1 hypothetical protein FRZ67_01360 [Panacibacter ginsenosidivorans]